MKLTGTTRKFLGTAIDWVPWREDLWKETGVPTYHFLATDGRLVGAVNRKDGKWYGCVRTIREASSEGEAKDLVERDAIRRGWRVPKNWRWKLAARIARERGIWLDERLIDIEHEKVPSPDHEGNLVAEYGFDALVRYYCPDDPRLPALK